MPLTTLPGYHPVGDVPVGGNLHRPEHGDVDMASSDHGERQYRIEKGGPGEHGRGLLAGVDEVGVLVAIEGVGAKAQDAVL